MKKITFLFLAFIGLQVSIASASIDVPNIDGLKHLAGDPVGQTAIVAAYHESGDGAGGPPRTWVSGSPSGTYTNNNGSIIVPIGGDGSGAWVGSCVYVWSVKEFGARGDGTTDDYQAFFALNAWATSQTNGGVVAVSPGSYVIGTSMTFDSDVELRVSNGAQLQPATTKALTINGPITAPATMQIFGGLGSVLISKTINPIVCADWFAGADMGAKINAALASLTGSDKGPGTIKVSPGSHSYSTGIDLTGAEGIRLCSDSGPLLSSLGARLLWTADSGNALKAPAGTHVEIDHLYFQYNSAIYDGNFINLNSNGAANDGTDIHIHHCGFAGASATQDLAAGLIALGYSSNVTIEHNHFNSAVVGIKGVASSVLVADIHDNYFGSGLDTAIVGINGAWKITNNTHQADPAAAVKTFFKLLGETQSITISNNLLGVDSGGGYGKIIDLTGYRASGVDISGNLFVGGSGTAIQLNETAGDSSGVNIAGNKFVGGVGVALGRADGVAIVGNDFGPVAIPWNGTSPTNLHVSGNRGDNMVNAGIVVANDGQISITPPGTADDGFGTIHVQMTVDNAQATYTLNGGGGSTTEVYDPSGLFTVTNGNAGTVNIYWDAASLSYKLQNKRGGSRTFVINYIGR